MPKKGHTEEQIIVADICRKLGVSQAVRRDFRAGVAAIAGGKQALKRLVADLSLDRQILQKIVSKKL